MPFMEYTCTPKWPIAPCYNCTPKSCILIMMVLNMIP